MLRTNDPLYLATHAIKTGSDALPPLFQHLADWTHAHLDVKILNVAFHRAREGRSPRLVLVFESDQDRKRACGKGFSVRRDFASFIRNTLEAIAPQFGLRLGFPIESLEIRAEAFAAPIVEAAIRRALSRSKILLLQKLSRFNVYDLRQNGCETVIVYYTEFSQQSSMASGEVQAIREIYAAHLKEYDPFGYCAPEQLALRLENLEEREDRKLVAFLPKPSAPVPKRVEPLPAPGLSFSYFLRRANSFFNAAGKRAMLF